MNVVLRAASGNECMMLLAQNPADVTIKTVLPLGLNEWLAMLRAKDQMHEEG